MNADDFGLSSEVNRGIEACYHRGILRSTSLMPNGCAFEEAVEIARRTPGLGVGIHLSLVGEKSVAAREELAGLVDGTGQLPASYMAFAKGYLMRRFGREHVRREISAQVEKFLTSGLVPTHIDSHQHVHLLPGIFELAVEAAQRANIPVIRVPFQRDVLRRMPCNFRQLQLFVLTNLSRRAVGKAHLAGLRTANYFWGLDKSGHLDEAALLDALNRAQPGINEVMCHPGFSSPELRAKYDWGFDWDAEAAALQSAAVLGLVEERGILLVRFS